MASASSIPSFASCLRDVIGGLRKAGLVEAGLAKFSTVNKPIGVQFAGGAYVWFEPGNPRDGLILDHQFHHLKNPLGAQRIVYKVEADSFAFIGQARPLVYGRRAEATELLHTVGISGIPYTSLYYDNFCVVTKEGFKNPKHQFVDNAGRNMEVILHELVDIMGALALLGRICGRVTTYRLSHKLALEACRCIEPSLVDCKT